MSLFQKTYEQISRNAAIKKSGKFNGIPYPYERFREYIPSIDKGQVIGITSYSGAAKSKFLRYNFVTYPYEFSLVNDYKILVDYYALEDSAERVFKFILCNYLSTKCKTKITIYDLESRYRELSSNVLKMIKDAEKYLADFSNVVRIKDSFTTPYEIKKDVMQTAASLGTIKAVDFTIDGKPAKKIVGFTPKDDTHWLILCDNLNNLEKGPHFKDNKEAMDHFVQKDCRLLYSKYLQATCVVIHQQALEAERQQFTNTGGSIIEKIKPSLANLGGTKEVVRSYHLMFSIFDPQRFKIPSYRGYDIQTIGNNFRELEILKTNDGSNNFSSALYFDGAGEVFRELPHSEKQKEELQKFMNWLQNERLVQKNKSLLF